MKILVTLSIGLANAKQQDVLEIPDEEVEGLSEEERQKVIDEHWQAWAWNYIDGGATIIE